MQLIPLVTLWPLLAHVQHTVSPCVMLSVFGTKAKPCPTVTSHSRGPGLPHGVGNGRGVGVGLAVARDEPINSKTVTTAAMNKSKAETVRSRRQINVLLGIVLIKCRSTALSTFLPGTTDGFQHFFAPIKLAAYRKLH
jgi:hypothetical protein